MSDEKNESARPSEFGGGTASRAPSSSSLVGINIEQTGTARGPPVGEGTPTPGENPPRPPPIGRGSRESSTDRPPLPQSGKSQLRSTPPPRRHRLESNASSFLSDLSLDMPGAGRGSGASHSRNVSWDMNIPPEASGLPPSPPRTLSLKDIQADNPMSEEAEAVILRTLDERRKRDPIASDFLSDVPDNVADIFRETSTAGSGNTPASPPSSSPPRGHRRLKSVATEVLNSNKDEALGDQLTGLNKLLKQMHEADSSDEESPVSPTSPTQTHRNRLRIWSKDVPQCQPSVRTDPKDSRAANSSLLHNADILFRRQSSTSQVSASSKGSPRPRDKKEPTAQAANTWIGVVADVMSQRRKSEGNEEPMTSTISEGKEMNDSYNDLEVGDKATAQGKPDRPQMRKNKRKEERESMFVRHVKKANRGMKEDFRDFGDFLAPRKAGIYSFLFILTMFFFVPAVAVSAILFYAAENPDLGRTCDLEECATISWLILYLVRCGVTFTLARATQAFFIDYLCLRARVTGRIIGPLFTLGIVQSKGFPFIMMAWSIYNFCLLSGRNVFAMHWLFWQDALGMFNMENSAGTVTYSKMNYTILTVALIGGILISIKRYVLGNYFGKRTYVRYGDQLGQVMRKIILISNVARHARSIEKSGFGAPIDHEPLTDYYGQTARSFDAEGVGGDTNSRRRRLSTTELTPNSKGADPQHAEIYSASLVGTRKQTLKQILGDWEEPSASRLEPTDTSIMAMLEFRQALTLMDRDFPFSVAFGPASTREACVESAQKVYERLLLNQPEGRSTVLNFDTIAELALDDDDNLNETQLKELVRFFRPGRDGSLTVVEFITTIDAIYKELRLLVASIGNTGQLDRAFKSIFNVGFYIIGGCIALAAIGLSPLALFFSFSSIILAFAFMIGSASAAYFEGILFILLRRPFDIGDRIHVSSVNDPLTISGSLTWFVENVNLYTTTVRLAATNEVATYSNGSLAASRIVNAARSQKAIIYIDFKFGVDVHYSKVQLFKHTITNFIKDRPRECIGIMGFRATQVQQDQGYIMYSLAVQHRESWQNAGPILDTKSALASFGLEVAKKLGMRYRAPPLPVNLAMSHHSATSEVRSSEAADDTSDLQLSPTPSMLPDVSAIAQLFEQKKER